MGAPFVVEGGEGWEGGGEAEGGAVERGGAEGAVAEERGEHGA